jgi:tRNA U34 5-methylaminomethyl-2-thiouridine-forming methyltransferase MnmC
MHKSTIIWDENQIPVSTYFDDVYFNTQGAIDETTYVFIDGNNLQQRFVEHNKDTFVVGETGFGSGLSFLILWQSFLHFRRHNPEHILKHLAFFSIEKYPLSLDELIKVHDSVISKNTPLFLLARRLQNGLINSSCQFDNVSLAICYADISHFSTFLTKQKVLVDAWFFDGFSPAKNPDMWTESLFKDCYALTALNGSFATFTAAGFVRRNLLNAGFNVLKRKGYGVKREMLIGYKDK